MYVIVAMAAFFIQELIQIMDRKGFIGYISDKWNIFDLLAQILFWIPLAMRQVRVLQCVAVCCNVCCSVLQCVLQCVAVCVAVCCSVLQCVMQCVMQCVTVCIARRTRIFLKKRSESGPGKSHSMQYILLMILLA